MPRQIAFGIFCGDHRAGGILILRSGSVDDKFIQSFDAFLSHKAGSLSDSGSHAAVQNGLGTIRRTVKADDLYIPSGGLDSGGAPMAPVSLVT